MLCCCNVFRVSYFISYIGGRAFLRRHRLPKNYHHCIFRARAFSLAIWCCAMSAPPAKAPPSWAVPTPSLSMIQVNLDADDDEVAFADALDGTQEEAAVMNTASASVPIKEEGEYGLGGWAPSTPFPLCLEGFASREGKCTVHHDELPKTDDGKHEWRTEHKAFTHHHTGVVISHRGRTRKEPPSSFQLSGPHGMLQFAQDRVAMPSILCLPESCNNANNISNNETCLCLSLIHI